MSPVQFRLACALLPGIGAVMILATTGCGGAQPSTPAAGSASTPATTQSGGSDFLSNILNSKNNQVCENNLKQIALSCHSYADTFLVLPTDVEANSKKLLSWRVHLLPFLEQQGLYQQFKQDEPWDSPHNKKLLDRMPAIYLDPRFQKKEDKPTVTYYQGFTGEGGVTGTPGGAALGIITNANGRSNTFLVVEAGEPVPWTKPGDLVHDLKKPLPPLGGPQRTDFYAAFCDLHVQKIPAKTSEKVLRCMINWQNTEPFIVP